MKHIMDCYHGADDGFYNKFVEELEERIENGIWDEKTGQTLKRAVWIIRNAQLDIEHARKWNEKFSELMYQMVKLP